MDYKTLEDFNIKSYKDEIGFLITSFNHMLNEIRCLIKEVYHAELKKNDADFYALQAQINPHFLYNTLESIRMIAERSNESHIADMIYTLGKLLRYNMSMKRKIVFITEEIDQLDTYMYLYRKVKGNSLEYNIDISADINGYVCPRFILQPLVENCIVHGIYGVKRKGLINVSVNDSDDKFIIQISDNGKGMNEELLKQIQGILAGTDDGSNEVVGKKDFIGIRNVSERIRIYFGDEAGIRINSRYGYGTEYFITFHKRKE